MSSSQAKPMTDIALMQQVLALAAKGAYSTQPNPRVGCILVNDGEIVGQGYHVSAGEMHAERLALLEAGEAARGATAYVNLEPCCHQGRTPPCTDGLIDAGVSKVVAAMLDPNPQVAGGGIELLTMAGIEVESGLLEEPARWLNRGFIKRMRRDRPWVTIKTAATLDGGTAAFDGQSKWITGQAARQQVHQLRAASAAIITGIDTVLADDPQLTARLPELLRQPYRVVLDSKLRLPIDARIIGADQQLIIFTQSDDQNKIVALTEMGVEVIQHQAEIGNRLNLDKVLADLSQWQFNEVLVEAGQTLAGAFLESGLVDEMVLFYAGSLLGDQAKSMFKFGAPVSFAVRPQFSVRDVQMIGDDFKVSVVNAASVSALN